MHLPFWLTTASLSPLLIHQGRKARRDTPRLPEATGDCHGQYGDGMPERRLLVIGESTAAGVGVQFNGDDETARTKIEAYLAGSLNSDRPTHTM